MDQSEMPVKPDALTYSDQEVAAILGCSPKTFLNRRRTELEREHNFPPRLPGTRVWSGPALRRWLETNGIDYEPQPEDEIGRARLDAENRHG